MRGGEGEAAIAVMDLQIHPAFSCLVCLSAGGAYKEFSLTVNRAIPNTQIYTFRYSCSGMQKCCLIIAGQCFSQGPRGCVCECVCACACVCVRERESWQCTTQPHLCVCLAVFSPGAAGSVHVVIPRLLPMSLN